LTKKDTLADVAERLYVVDQMTINEVANLLKVHEKSIRNWKEEFKWDEKRKQLIKTKTQFHEEMYNFARKLMGTIEYDLDNGGKIDQARLFTFAKMLPLITKIKDYEDTTSAKNQKEENKGITPDFVKLIETEILGMNPSEE
jgi:hypothetical protein